MAKSELRARAHVLRRQGESITNIARTLGVSKGSVSTWCCDIRLTDMQRAALIQKQVAAGHAGRMRGAEINRLKKVQNIAEQEECARKTIGALSSRDKLMLGIGLYWGEGVKGAYGGASIVNSDPAILLAARDWFEQLGVERSQFNPYVFISEVHKNREQAILEFWSKKLAISRTQFHRIIFLKGRPKKVYENHNSYYGVLALRVRRSSNLKYNILGLIKACKTHIEGKVVCRGSSVG